jgi:hypothetical protein
MTPGIELGMGLITLGLLAGLVWLWFLFFRTQVRAVRKCRKTAQKIYPDLIWIGMVPGFGFFFMFWSIGKITGTIWNEFADRGIIGAQRQIVFTGIIGYAFLIIPIFCVIPFVWYYPLIGSFILALIYWYQMGRLSAILSRSEVQPGRVGDDTTVKVTE